MPIFPRSALANFRGRIWRAAHIPAALAFVVVLVAGLFAEHQNRLVQHNVLRSDVLTKVSVLRARLEGTINSNIQLVRGLVATLTTEPDMDQERFSKLGVALLGTHSQLRHLAAARDLVIDRIHPLEGNEKALGIDYNSLPKQREAVYRARDTGRLVLAGPVDLVQGGTGLIGRFPVFVPDADGADRFWGIVSAVIDIEEIYAATGLLERDLGIEVAITGHDALGQNGQHFFGSPDVLSNDPVLVNVLLPAGHWELAATPRGGWDVDPPNLWRLRMWMLIAAGLIMVPALVTGHLMAERQDNIAQMQRRKAELEALSRRLTVAIETSKVGIWETRLGDHVERWDDQMNRIYGLPADGSGRTLQDWIDRLHPHDRARALKDFEKALETSGNYTSQYRIVRPDGSVRHLRALGRVYVDGEGDTHVVGVNWDVTDDVRLTDDLTLANAALEARNDELEQARQRIEYTAMHDSLTGLPNRRFLDDVLADHANRFEAGSEQAAVLHIDLDRFKHINDTLGHAAGDAMLVHTAEILRAVMRPSDFVARVGGDEFVIVCRRLPQSPELEPERLAGLADLVIVAMQQPLMHEGHECRCGVSIGISSDTDAAADPRKLLVHADIALYRAKNRGRNRYQFFNETLQSEIIRTKRIADEILSGIERNEFVAYYQPQFDPVTLDVIGVEALVRWQHPSEGLLAPGAFLKIAEELNVVSMIDRMVLEQTISDFASWKSRGLGVPKASVNVSAKRLHDEALIDSLRSLPIEPGTLSFELVESIFMDDNDDLTTWNVEQIKELGIDIEIDDFGTGYASILSLIKLSPSRLKIDRQFIMPIVRSKAQRRLVGSIVEIGRSLGIEVLAEGVETMEHARILRDLGCNGLQGYAFARPMSSEDLVGFLRARRWREAS
jgi:diguanylate cyclase (GGDEF)-like protein/PAS domain S-box-containing protein